MPDNVRLAPQGEETAAVALPTRRLTPWRRLVVRLGSAVAILVGSVLVVYADRGGYVDANNEGGLTLLDCLYYVTVTLSTTGYGDVTPATPSARFINAFVITPARVAFLVLLIGTTLEVLASEGRMQFRIARWRNRMKDHVVVVGYGIKGRSAVDTLISNGRTKEGIVIVDSGDAGRRDALAAGYAVVAGDATRRSVLSQAGLERARQVIIATARDDTNILTTLTVRQLNPNAYVVATVRDRDNVPLIRQSGADSVIVSADSAGRMLGSSAVSAHLGRVLEDLIVYGEGIEVAERETLMKEVGLDPSSIPDQVVAVIRDDRLHYYFDPTVSKIARGDRLIVIRSAVERPWAPRPGTHGELTSMDTVRSAIAHATAERAKRDAAAPQKRAPEDGG
ncbi:MAG: NAD-binding protein [Dermatophilaceae bacterium]